MTAFDEFEIADPEGAESAGGLADGAGLVASVACAIHCAAMPLVIGYLPMLGLSWLADPSFHRVMAIACFMLALWAFLPGFRRHGSLTPTFFGSVGVGLLALAAFGLEGECCPSCASVAAQPVSGCTDAGCTACAASAPAPAPEADAAALAWALPLITPVGGVFLIAGHVSNHRRSCACCGSNCCSDQPENSVPGDFG